MTLQDFAATDLVDLVGWVESSEPTTLSSGRGGFRRLHPPYKMLPDHPTPLCPKSWRVCNLLVSVTGAGVHGAQGIFCFLCRFRCRLPLLPAIAGFRKMKR